ncbi:MULTISPECIES: thiamine diphosphokinase [Staphylococcus]|uniref:thiamine diphosphokinase n=1 Tax=Staphylococcus TaxID=1279 RepID=UPI000D1B149F|nr:MULTISPECIES: thiamine diphosphokinase [Staphylococcus]MBA1352767.1 thiamine diphosphokinase [Staphylococcus cohnii]MBA1390942.1 thiamine diphosphokinase [Staphylococcus cohnii]MCE5034224.1 thiamine diphosphokinase [Staphylococcus cohnii]PTF05673.1 thiamine diphosphokinase [Staphylococcus cohnii]PTG66727.1 thiamine diphosphokinase [Staphylococcus cohnii]
MKVNLLCGARNLPENILQNKTNEAWIGIDRGALILIESGIMPQFAVGDFDSITKEEKDYLTEKLAINPYNSEKDDTDLALGIEQAISSGYSEICVYGATGGRLDHFMGAMQILEKPEYTKKQINIKIIDQQNEISYLSAKDYHIDRDLNYPYISFIPIAYPTVISLINFKYELKQASLQLGSTLTISNELIKPQGIVSIHSGSVLMIKSKD